VTELLTLTKIHHPNTVQFLGAVTRTKPLRIITEIMDGGSLECALRRPVKLPLRRSLEIALDCARGLLYLHLANPYAIIHRDLKPSNVLFGGFGVAMGADELVLDTGVAKLTDFGLSKTLTTAGLPKFGVRDLRGMFRKNGMQNVPDMPVLDVERTPRKDAVRDDEDPALGVLPCHSTLPLSIDLSIPTYPL
jgi:serine/threonine protein kinase